MTILLNGNMAVFPETAVLNDAIIRFSFKPEHIVAEVNGEIIPRALWPVTPLKPESRIELVTFVGGG